MAYLRVLRILNVVLSILIMPLCFKMMNCKQDECYKDYALQVTLINLSLLVTFVINLIWIVRDIHSLICRRFLVVFSLSYPPFIILTLLTAFAAFVFNIICSFCILLNMKSKECNTKICLEKFDNDFTLNTILLSIFTSIQITFYDLEFHNGDILKANHVNQNQQQLLHRARRIG
ncbi:MAG: hypothetical protein MHMPM18_002654, partial [Marteilia pararefringens]